MSSKLLPVAAIPQVGNSASRQKRSPKETDPIVSLWRCFRNTPQQPQGSELSTKAWEIVWSLDIEHARDIQAVHRCIRAKTITFAQITDLYQKQVRPTFHQRKLLTQFYTTQKQSNFPSTAICIFYKLFGSWANYFFKDAAEILAAEDAFKRITSEAEINRQDRIPKAESAAISIKKRLNVICQSNPSCLCNPETLQHFKTEIIALKKETREIINELNSCRDELIFMEAEELKITKKTPKKLHNSISEIFSLISTLEGLSCEISDTEEKLANPIQSIIYSFNQLKTENELEKKLNYRPDGYTYSSEISAQKAVLNQVNYFIKNTIFSILKDTWVSNTGTPLETLNKQLDALVSSTNEQATPTIRHYLLTSPYLNKSQIEDLLNIRIKLQNRLNRIITTKENIKDPIQRIITSFQNLKNGYELEETIRHQPVKNTYYLETQQQEEVLNQANDFIKNTILSILKDTWASKTGTPLNTLNNLLDALVSSTNDYTQIIRALLHTSPSPINPQIEELLQIIRTSLLTSPSPNKPQIEELLNILRDHLLTSPSPNKPQKTLRDRLQTSPSPNNPQFEELLNIRRVIQKRLHDAEETAEAHN